ncbi:MAG: maltose ABC transporter permease MalF [Aggregatilineales bacterium]
MSAASTQVKPSQTRGGLNPTLDGNIYTIGIKLVVLMLLNAFLLILSYTFFYDGNVGLGIVFLLITILIDAVIFVPALSAIRWMAPGLALIIFLVLYPIVYTVSTAFTNYGDGHLFTKDQAIRLIDDRQYVPDDAITYNWEAYQNESGDYGLWLTRETDDGLEAVFARVGQEIEIVDNPPEEVPADYDGFVQLDRAGRTQALTALSNTVFGEGEDTAQILNRREVARPLAQRYVYDDSADTFTDQSVGTVYVADNETGAFVAQNNANDQLTPGYRVNIGLDNFTRLINDRGLSGPLVDIFVWTVLFALLSVFTTFAAGLFMAMVMNDPGVPFRKILRSLLIIPYAIPGVIGILVWRGMLNQNLGIITNAIADSFINTRIPWFTDPVWAKIAIILVNLWLGYPYMMLICSGALSAIPSDIYEAAAVDGATPTQRFWRITLPLLLVTVGPLLVASFAFNFNNYLMIELLTRGDPPIAGSPVPAGYTDILISYTYGLAFGSDRGADYGYASAITIIIFGIVAGITLLQYRFTKAWEETGENV